MPTPLDIFGTETIRLHRSHVDEFGTITPDMEGVPVTGCWVEESPHLTRARDGAEVVSTAQIAAPKSVIPAIDEETTVTLPSGRRCTIVSVSSAGAHALPLPDHVIIHLE